MCCIAGVRNSKLVLFAFGMTILFQITALKFIWGMEWTSRLLNITTILIFSTYALNGLIKSKFNKVVVFFYIIPGSLVYTGYFINISLSAINNINVLNQFGLIIPWAIYLSIPSLIKSRTLDVGVLWRYYNTFIFLTVFISIVEYYLMFSGLVLARPILTDGGPFLAGYFSMLYAIETGELHYRFYAAFLEPGTLAMFLLPAMAYAFLHRKYFALVVYSIAMYLSDSLGGVVGVAMLIPLVIYFKLRQSNSIAILFALVAIILGSTYFAGDLNERYDSKNNSRIEREVSLSGITDNWSSLILEYPFGLPLAESTEQSQKNSSYYGATFTPGNAFNLGGILSIIGYVSILIISFWFAIVSLFRMSISITEQVAAISTFCLLPFIFQRTSIWDYSIFPLLFAPFVISLMHSNTDDNHHLNQSTIQNP